jgi:MFS transporter, DHA2 family, multidrug resistance protein
VAQVSAAPAGGQSAPAHKYAINPWPIAFTVTIATFMEALDTSIANVALPHIAGNLSATADQATWVLTSYLVSNGIILPLGAWLSEIMGRKRFYMTCVATFTVCSFLCGIAPSLGMLILFRVLQGAGGGGLQPSEQAILADTFPPERLGMAFAIYGMAVVLAPSIGPTLGGWITDNYSWRWIFYINVPIGIISLLLTNHFVQDPPYLKEEMEKRRRGRRGLNIDYIGIGLIALGIGCLQVVLDKGQEDDWFASHFIATLSVISLTSIVALVIWELRHKSPVIELRLLKNFNFAAACVMIFVLGVALYAATALVPLFVQELAGYTAELAGLVVSPGGLVMIVTMPMVGRLSSRVQARWLAATGFLITGLALWHMTRFDLQANFGTYMWSYLYQRLGVAFMFIPINTLAYLDVPPGKNNQISSMINMFRNLGASIGISMVSTLTQRRAQIHQDTLSMHLSTFNPALRDQLSGLSNNLFHSGMSSADASHQALGRVYVMVQTQASTEAYLDTLKILAIICLCLLPVFPLLKSNDPGAKKTMAVH